MSRSVLRLLAVLGCLVLVPNGPAFAQHDADSAAVRAVREFTFAAAGDHGANPDTAASLRRLDRSDAEFYLALGDLDYDQTTSDRAWCRYVKRHLPRKGRRFPFEVVVGNHEQDGGPDGRIRRHAACLPDRLGSTAGPRSRYGAEYAFTYPRRAPFAKFVMLAPNLTVEGEQHTYEPGSSHRRWLRRQIASARRNGIPWVIAGMHYPCLTTGTSHGCDAGTRILNLLVRKRVDLVLVGHNHIYERSKQVRLGEGCRRIRKNRFDRDCVVAGWRDAVYREDAGTMLVTAGRFGGRLQGADPGDAERPYFVKVDGNALGFVRYAVRPDRLHGRFLSPNGSARDTFEIVRR